MFRVMPALKSLPPNVQFHDDIDLLVWRPVGTVNEAAVNKILRFLRKHEDAAPRPFDRFTDTSAEEAMELTFKYIFHVALYRRLSYAGRPPVKSAFYVTDPAVARLIRIHAMLTAHSPLQVAMFDDREAAAKWLEVPVERLVA